VTLTARTVFDFHHERLSFEWQAGQRGEDRRIRPQSQQAAAGLPLSTSVGHLNLIHPNRIQVIGHAELAYLDNLGKNSHADALERLFGSLPALVVVADGAATPLELRQHADRTDTPLVSSPLATHKIISYLQYYLSNTMADCVILHGVFMEILGIGVLITGKSGVGKSELALELISRSHRLVADDAPEFRRIAPDTLSGSCPPALSGFLEVRGLGVLNIRAMFGDSAVKNSKNMRLIIRLQHMSEAELASIDRLHGSRQTVSVLEVDVPQVTLPVAPGHNLAVLAEGAARNHVLRLKGYDAAQAFIERQQKMISEGER
jgi:HPr kinase/phosphorylase